MARAAQQVQAPPRTEVPGSTLLMLVLRVNEVTDSPEETVDTVHRLLDTGQVRLTGNFRGVRLRRVA